MRRGSRSRSDFIFILVGLLLTALGCQKADDADSRARRGPLGHLRTVRVVAESAAVWAEQKQVARVGRGRMFGVIAEQDGRVKVQVCDGKTRERGWLAAEDVRFVTDADTDLAAEALRLSQRLHPKLDVEAYATRMRALAERTAEAARAHTTPRARARAIARQLFVVEGFAPGESGTDMLDAVLDSKRGRCLGLSLLFLCAAEPLAMPFYLVSAPRHAFVRYDNGRERFNIEMTSGGAVHEGLDFLRRHLGPTLADRAGGVDHLTLPKARTLGLLSWTCAGRLRKEGRANEAIALCARAIELNPFDAAAFVQMAMLLDSRGDPRGAHAVATRALDINPQDATAHVVLGSTLGKLGRHDESCEAFRKAAHIDPSGEHIYRAWGTALAQAGKHEEACAKYAVSAEMDPTCGTTYFNWGLSLAHLGRKSLAIAKLDEAARRDPSLRPDVNRAVKALADDSQAPILGSPR